MPAQTVVQELHALRRSFGRAAAARKLRLLVRVAALPRMSTQDVLLLQATLDFMRAYPDSVAIRGLCKRVVAGLRSRLQATPALARAARLVNSGVPGSTQVYGYSYRTLLHLTTRYPGCLEIDWDEVDDEAQIAATLEMLLTAVENEAMEDVSMWWGEWAAHVRPAPMASDLQLFLSLFQRAHFTPSEQANLYDALNLQIRYRLAEAGSGRCEVELPPPRVSYQKHDIARERLDLVAEIRRPLRKPRALNVSAGRRVVDVAVRALACRNLEIHPLFYANPRDVVLFEAARGIRVALVGVRAAQRGALAALYFFLVLKNGVPIAYGPASPFLGACEMGINLFPEFRGGEIRYLYAQVMRLLHHVLAVDYFYLTSYGMGVGNEEAIRSGAFWFYRSLGFSASNPTIESLARSEEERMRAEPGYRSSIRMLRRLSDTEAYLDLSAGRCKRFPFGRLGLAVSRFIARHFDGDRGVATRRCGRRVSSALGAHADGCSPPAQRVLQDLAVLLAMIPDLSVWSARDKASLVRILEGKASERSEAAACIRMKQHRRLSRALFDLATSVQTVP